MTEPRDVLRVLAAVLLGAVGTIVLTPLVKRLAERRGWVCHPRADRWSRRTVALMGGLAIFAGTGCGLLPTLGLIDFKLAALMLASAFMFVVGAVDDRLQIKPHTKLLAQVLAAAVLVHAGFRFGLPGPTLSLLDPLLTIFWLVGVGNAFNLLDNMDGLCAGIAAIGAAFLGLVQLADGNVAGATAAAALAGACLGFLRYNRHPASIFMGDCGSLFLGFFLAGAVLLHPGQAGGRGLLTILALPALLMLIPLMDTTLVTVLRKLHGRPVSQGGRDHSSHRLVAIGLSEPRAVRLLYGLAACGGLAALAVQELDWYLSTLLMLVVLFTTGLLAWLLGGVRVYDEPERLGELLALTPIPLLAQHRYRRRLGEVLVDTAAVALGWYVAFALRYEGGLAGAARLGQFADTLALVVAGHLLAYGLVGVYRGIWRYTSVSDLPRFLSATAGGLVISSLALGLVGRFGGLSHSLLLINLLVQFTLLSGTRVSLKLLRDRLLAARDDQAVRVLGVGVGAAAAIELRRLREDLGRALKVVGLIAPDPGAVGLTLLGVPVLGTAADVPELLERHRIAEVMLLDDSFPVAVWRSVAGAAATRGAAIRIVKRTVEPAFADADAAD